MRLLLFAYLINIAVGFRFSFGSHRLGTFVKSSISTRDIIQKPVLSFLMFTGAGLNYKKHNSSRSTACFQRS